MTFNDLKKAAVTAIDTAESHPELLMALGPLFKQVLTHGIDTKEVSSAKVLGVAQSVLLQTLSHTLTEAAATESTIVEQ